MSRLNFNGIVPFGRIKRGGFLGPFLDICKVGISNEKNYVLNASRYDFNHGLTKRHYDMWSLDDTYFQVCDGKFESKLDYTIENILNQNKISINKLLIQNTRLGKIFKGHGKYSGKEVEPFVIDCGIFHKTHISGVCRPTCEGCEHLVHIDGCDPEMMSSRQIRERLACLVDKNELERFIEHFK